MSNDCTGPSLRHNRDVPRMRFIDWARGIAVIAMVIWHTADGWIAPALRIGQGWSLLRFIGGLAAPSFLMLAGVGAALAAREHAKPGAHLAALTRGAEIVLLGYVLRLQGWLIDAGGLVRLHQVRAWLPLGAGYVLLFFAMRALPTARDRAKRLVLIGLGAVLIGLVQVPLVAPGRLPRLLQVDVLQAIGASLALLALGERRVRLLQRPALALALAALVALATEPISAILPSVIPVPIAAYLGRFDPPKGQPAAALFPLFPWFSYACAGAAVGTFLRQSPRVERVVVLGGIVGAAIVLTTSEAHAPVQLLIRNAGWIIHPLRVLFRVGLVLVLLLVAWLWVTDRRGRVVVAYGRASLRIYWAHLLVAYGVLSAPWHKRLDMGDWLAFAFLLLALMWLLALLRKRALVRPRMEAST